MGLLCAPAGPLYFTVPKSCPLLLWLQLPALGWGHMPALGLLLPQDRLLAQPGRSGAPRSLLSCPASLVPNTRRVLVGCFSVSLCED